MTKVDRIQIGRIPIDLFTETRLNNTIGKIVANKEKKTVLHSNAHMVQLANSKYPWLIDYFNTEVDYVMCDGGGLRLLANINGLKTPEKIAYNVWFWEFSTYCAENDISIFLLGAKKGIAEKAAQNLKEKNPTLKVHHHHGYYDKTQSSKENQEVIRKVNQSKANVLLVCFGMPNQEQYVKENFHQFNVNVFMTGGGALDYFAGEVKVCPPIISKLYMEWFYRMCQRPKKLFKRYFFGNIRFIYYALKYRKHKYKM